MDAAERAASRALELGTEDGDDLLVARATNNLGIIANIRGRHDAALALYAFAVPAYQRLGSSAGLAECYHNMAITYRDASQLARAEDHERRASEFAREAGDARLGALTLLGQAELTSRRGDWELAEARAGLAARALAAAGDPIRQGDALRLAGVAAQRLGRPDEAARLLDEALALVRDAGGRLNEAEVLEARSALRRELGDAIGADADAAAARGIMQTLGRDELSAMSSRL